jgi:hypothetical protein
VEAVVSRNVHAQLYFDCGSGVVMFAIEALFHYAKRLGGGLNSDLHANEVTVRQWRHGSDRCASKWAGRVVIVRDCEEEHRK